MNSELSIVIPCYNEEGNLPTIWQKINVLISNYSSVEIILVNNGSTDNSANILQKLSAENQNGQIKICTVVENTGYGNGILQGLQMATANVLCWTHADLQTDIEDCIKAYALFKKENNETVLIKGNRKNRNWLDAFFTWGMQIYTNIKLKTSLEDINAQPKLFHRNFWNSITNNAPLDFSLDLYVLYNAKQVGNIKTIDVFFKKRLHGEAKGGGSLKGKWKLIKRTFAYINQLSKSV